MVLCDVGVLLHAMIAHAEHHALCRRELARLLATPGELALSELVLAAVVRIGTNPRVFQPTPTPADVFGFVDALRSGSDAPVLAPGERHWTIFRELVLQTGIRGGDTTDAYLAALSIEHDCEWWTTDRDFARFPGLRWRNLLSR